jgi:hypothetical protein
MARPQQPELARSAKTDLDPDHIETGLQGQKAPATGGETGPVPAENQPGHHPPKEQDKPDLDAFAAKIGADASAPSATNARKPPRPKTASPKAAAGKATAATSGGPSKAETAKPSAAKTKATKPASRPATQSSPAPPPKIQTTRANRPASAPGWPESAPAPDDLGPLEGPEAAEGPEPRLVSLAMLPLRETVRRLERLERALTEKARAKTGRGPRNR